MNVTPIGKQADWPVDQILRNALDRDLSGVVLIGWLKEPEDGKRFWVSSSYNSEEAIIYALRCAERLVLNGAFQDE